MQNYLLGAGMYDFEGNEKHLRFHSDAANSRPGFQIRLRQVECLPEDDEGQLSPQPPPFRPLQQGGFTASVLDEGGGPQHEHKCDKILTNRLFDIRSPNYPGGYPPNLDCKYIVFQVRTRYAKRHVLLSGHDFRRALF
ncbi:hypothetical protein HPB48_022511 [Haemaphysalis longicornis]|uniref:CUB domain-containing protein n=1 Tax=Haemaphysalis longicornis TaxID=44386 RepID=A0A9J6FCV7_HAELO|nr:hypothetical protein HPB48_022511 [Haemaphysalis longicornis]